MKTFKEFLAESELKMPKSKNENLILTSLNQDINIKTNGYPKFAEIQLHNATWTKPVENVKNGIDRANSDFDKNIDKIKKTVIIFNKSIEKIMKSAGYKNI